MSRLRVLVTGGTGFLGRHLADALMRAGHQVSLLGRDFGAAGDLIAQGARPVAADLRDRAAVVDACRRQDAVVHAGALSAAWGRRANFHAVNVGGTQAVVDGCRVHDVRRLVYVSSPAVIFDGHDHVNLTEAAPYPQRHLSVYAETKKLGEEAVRGAAAAGLETVVIRPKAIFGPGDRALLPRLIAAARQGRLRQFGDGKNLVDLTYVDNVVQALVLALSEPAANGGVYFITNDEHVPLWPVIRRLLDRVGLPSQLRRMPLPLAMTVAALMEARAALTGKEPLLTRYSVAILARTQTYDITAARRDLGYAPIVSVAAGIDRTLESLEP